MNEELEAIVEKIGIALTIKDLAVICSDRSEEADDDESLEAWADVAEELDNIDAGGLG